MKPILYFLLGYGLFFQTILAQTTLISDATWLCTSTTPAVGWNTNVNFNTANWLWASSGSPCCGQQPVAGTNFVWGANNSPYSTIYFRKKFGHVPKCRPINWLL